MWLMTNKCSKILLLVYSNMFSISTLLRVYKIKWREEVFQVNQQRQGTVALRGGGGELKPKCNVVKVTPHLCLVKTFQGVVKWHVCCEAAAPQYKSFRPSYEIAKCLTPLHFRIEYLTHLNVVWYHNTTNKTLLKWCNVSDSLLLI